MPMSIPPLNGVIETVLYADDLPRAIAFDQETPGARQIVVMEVDLVQTSCGFAVPQFDYVSDRQLLVQWAEKQGEAGLEVYRRDKNARSLDGFSTGLLESTS